MFHVVLFEPEIAPNTGNIIRLCANSGAELHLVEPLGFELGDRALKRAGLDYHEYANVCCHASLEACVTALGRPPLYAFSTRGTRRYCEAGMAPGSALLFGPETRGLPPAVLASLAPERVLRLPMRPRSRSLNLSNAVAIALYEAWRQNGFDGGG